MAKLDISLHGQGLGIQDQEEAWSSASVVMTLLTDIMRGSNHQWGTFNTLRNRASAR